MSDKPDMTRDEDPLLTIRAWLETDPFDGPPLQLEPLVIDWIQGEPP